MSSKPKALFTVMALFRLPRRLERTQLRCQPRWSVRPSLRPALATTNEIRVGHSLLVPGEVAPASAVVTLTLEKMARVRRAILQRATLEAEARALITLRLQARSRIARAPVNR